jgi:hypothetical protein
MAIEPTNVGETDEVVVEARPARSTGNPLDKVAPTCMIWAMFIGLGILITMILIWEISHIGVVNG